MRRGISRKALVVITASVTIAAAGAFATTAMATSSPPENGPAGESPEFAPTDNLPNPLADKRSAAREQAVVGVLSGEYQAVQNGQSTVVDLTRGRHGNRGHGHRGPRYVELAREATDQIFVILAEFGDELHPSIPPDPNAQRTDGPLHNEIPRPDRRVDNSTVWRSDYNQAYFQDLYFGGGESVKKYYETQSSGRYSVDGTVTNWVKVDFSQSRYGTDLCGSIVCSTVWALVQDAANIWYNDQLAQGRTEAEVNADLAGFDVWDRYDWDLDGDFNESDGYIDHFQIVHAGGDQADGDPIYASDAIWSHRWYTFTNLIGATGPDGFAPFGGTEIGNSNIWVGDYTIQPENGGRSVFYHEYAHDLGLPDDYNLINGGDNNNEHWTLMAQSRLGAKRDGGIGERGGDLGAWNKLQLGWLDYELVGHDQSKALWLGPQEYNSNDPQALIVSLPPQEVEFDLGPPAAGEHQWYSGHQHDSTLTMTHTVSVPAGDPQLTFKTRYDVEVDWDYAQVLVNGTPIVGTVNGVVTSFDDPDTPDVETNQNGAAVGWDGQAADWVDGVFDLSAYAGQEIELTFLYAGDPAVSGDDPALPDGVFLDEIAVTGGFAEGAENGVGDWDVVGWAIFGSTITDTFPHYYIAGYRSYVSYDRYLETGPYYFGYGTQFPDKVDHYAYQEGLLISYFNTLYEDNDTFEHPGAGRNLYIDAHPEPFARSNGDLWRARVQVYDAPFGKDRTDRVTLRHDGKKERFGNLRGNPVFRDTDTYWYEELPNHGVILPGVGVQIRVLQEWGGKVLVKVN